MELEICFCMKCMRHGDTLTEFDLNFLKGKKRLPSKSGLDEFFWSGN